MNTCSNCKHCEFVVDRWEHGEVVGEYDACKLDGTIITDKEQLTNCEEWEKRKIKPFDFTIKPEILECPF